MAGALVLVACAAAAVALHGHASREAVEASGWRGKIVRVAHGAADGSPGILIEEKGVPVAVAPDTALPAGSRLSTDARTRARVALDDGTDLVLDRSTRLVILPGRSLRLDSGQLAMEFESAKGAPDIHVTTPRAELTGRAAKLVLTSTGDGTTLEVSRGSASLDSGTGRAEVGAGEEAVVRVGAPLAVTPANDIAERLVWSERLHGDPDGAEVRTGASSGLGELVARRPGKTDEKDRALHLSTHTATIRIAANVARTEIEETFANDTNDDLEGIYRFPLPPGAEMEKLALDVDGKLVPGSFVEKAKAAAIWRGAIQNAAPKPQKQEEEIVWVPGPWHDPALLEWNGGGRFELKIFPIPKHGSRRIQIAYTETVPQVADGRRYVYALPESPEGTPAIDRFSVDVQVRGADPARTVHAGGYDLDAVPTTSGTEMSKVFERFVPAGDLLIDYALEADRSADLTAWGYRDVAPVKDSRDAKEEAASANEADPFVALAIRPKLPRWEHAAWRDQVIVVDDGHSMTGERFKQATQLASRIAREMDRRDRVTVLACDVTCRAWPAGWMSPGAGAGQAVQAYFEGMAPDGATDLVAAVRAGASVADRSLANDLRVILLSSGVAGAGYRSLDKLSIEVASALPDAKAELVTVPIGGDADHGVLRELARGGGGVMVPYAPGEASGEAALAVLNATYGATLRDVEVTLPEGLYASAPTSIAPIRGGGEEIVVARMRGDRVQGDAVLKGKVNGQPFEARYPLDVRATTEPGNAFVPRLYASRRIASLERTSGDTARPELVRLSQRFAVPSRYTSLLVLESEAMFRAFGIDRTARVSAFTGENEAVASFADTPGKASSTTPADLGVLGSAGGGAVGDEELRDALGGGGGTGAGFGAVARPVARKAAGHLAESGYDAPPAPPPPSTVARAAASAAPVAQMAQVPARDSAWRPNVGRWMRREWFRSASVSRPSPPASAEKIAAARAALAATPEERGKHKELARLLALDGSLGELEEVVARWTAKDPLDPDAVAARADVLARQGHREEALRVLSGILGTRSGSRGLTGGPKGELDLTRTVATAYARAGKPEACSFWIAAAELAATDTDSVAHAAGCERANGRDASAERWLSALSSRQAPLVAKYEEAARVRESLPERATWGDIVVDASWDESADLDIVIIDPAGNRQSWSSRSGSLRVADPRSMHHEAVALSSNASGAFAIEVVRSRSGDTPVHGSVRIRALGDTETKTFDLSDQRAAVARVDIQWNSRLVPADNPPVL